jgi:hypothetical protein
MTAVYTDNVIDIGRTFQEQNKPRKVFQNLREAQLKLNSDEYQLFRMGVIYMGHIVSPSGVITSPEKLEGVKMSNVN